VLKNWSRPTSSHLEKEVVGWKEACEPYLSTNPKGEFLPCKEIRLHPNLQGEKFLYRFSPQNPVLWINFRGTGKTRIFGSNWGRPTVSKKGKLSRIFPLVRRFGRCW
jgi:hypothetical protein